MTTSPKPRVCIIGAGSSGIAAAKVLHERGINFDCYELSNRIGGNWVLNNSNGVSAAYKSLHINTSRSRMEFSDFPMDVDLPNFARHDQIAKYFESYAQHFGFIGHIRFETGVEQVSPLPENRFDVRLSTGETITYDHVIVANGHHWDPRYPEPDFPGSADFTGEIMHSHQYLEPQQLTGKKVVVLGMGNSAMDIAVESSHHAQATYLAHRSGVHIIPKYLFGRPYDAIGAHEFIPSWGRWPLARVLMRVSTGKMSTYGLKNPDHRFAQAHPTMSSHILDRLAHGAITPMPGIDRYDGSEVVFTDGSRREADLVIYCTGYKISFPFFASSVLDPSSDNRVRLYKRIFHPQISNLSFVGLVQPLGAIMPIAERQSQIIAEKITGTYALPGKATMHQEIDRHAKNIARRYVASKRHTIQVDFDDYMLALRIERLKGRRRAQKNTANRA